jgi:predicted DNA-binding WGR domain protein
MRRFELIEGTSNKFWEVELSGNELTVRFGRIGTAGQGKTKDFADAGAAQKEYDKLVREKTGKGYIEVGAVGGTQSVSATAPAPVAAPSPVAEPLATPVPKPAPPAAPAAVPAPIQPSPAADIAWPQGGFQWTPALRERLPVVRGVHAPDDSAFWLGLQLQPGSASQEPFHVERFNRSAAELGQGWRVWTPEQMEAELRPERLAEPNLQDWAARMAQMAHHQPTAVKASLPPELAMKVGVIQLTEQGLRLHGLMFMLDLVLWLSRLHSWAGDVASVRLRAALARAPQAEHDAVIARLEGARWRRENAPAARLALPASQRLGTPGR